MDIITENLYKIEGSFYCLLYEEGEFDHVRFFQLTGYIASLSASGISEDERMKRAVELWELAYMIQGLLTAHYNEKDVFTIGNLSSNELNELPRIIFYACNWFTYNKPMNRDLLKFGVW